MTEKLMTKLNMPILEKHEQFRLVASATIANNKVEAISFSAWYKMGENGEYGEYTSIADPFMKRR